MRVESIKVKKEWHENLYASLIYCHDEYLHIVEAEFTVEVCENLGEDLEDIIIQELLKNSTGLFYSKHPDDEYDEELVVIVFEELYMDWSKL